MFISYYIQVTREGLDELGHRLCIFCMQTEEQKIQNTYNRIYIWMPGLNPLDAWTNFNSLGSVKKISTFSETGHHTG